MAEHHRQGRNFLQLYTVRTDFGSRALPADGDRPQVGCTVVPLNIEIGNPQLPPALSTAPFETGGKAFGGKTRLERTRFGIYVGASGQYEIAGRQGSGDTRSAVSPQLQICRPADDLRPGPHRIRKPGLDVDFLGGEIRIWEAEVVEAFKLGKKISL